MLKLNKAVVLTVLIGLAFATFAADNNGNPEAWKRLLNEPKGGSLYVDAFTATEVRPRIGPSASHMSPEDIEQIQAEYPNVIANYQQERKAWDSAKTSVKTRNFLATTGVTIATAAAGAMAAGSEGILTPVALGLTATVTNYRLKVTEEALLSGLDKSAAAMLNDKLARSRAIEGKTFREETFITPDQAMHRLYGKNPVADPQFQGMESEERDVVLHHILKQLESRMAKKDWEVDQNLTLNQEQIKQNRTNIVAIQNTFVEFSKQTQTNFVTMQQTQTRIIEHMSQISNRVDDLEKGVEHHTKDISFLQEYTFGKMSPKEQLSALNGGFFPGMPETERSALQERITLVKDRQELINQTVQVLDGASVLISVAARIGVDPKIVGAAQTAVKIGGAAVNVITSITSGNIIGAIGAVAGLFSGPDVAEVRHEEVMKTLSALGEGQQKIMDQIVVLQKGQQVIIENQARIMDAIVAVSKRIEEQHDATMSKLDGMHMDILINRAMILAGLKQNLTKCGIFTGAMDQKNLRGRAAYGYVNGRFQNYAGLYAHYFQHRAEFSACMEILPAIFQGPTSSTNPEPNFDVLFRLPTYVDSDNSQKLQAYIDKVHKPTFNYLQRRYQNNTIPELEEVIASLFAPLNSFRYLEAKVNGRMKLRELGGNLPQGFPSKATPLSLLEMPLSAGAIIEYVNHLIRMHYYFELLNGSSNFEIFQNPNELIDRKIVSERGGQLLSNSLRLIDTAIAQQALVAGESLLPGLEKTLWAGPQSADYAEILKLLQTNRHLAHNLVRYMFAHDVGKKGGTQTAYEMAYNSTYDVALKELTLFPWEFHFEEMEKAPQSIPAGWSVKIAINEKESIFVPVPDTEAIRKTDIIYAQDMKMLVDLREKVINELLSYTLSQRMPEETRKTFRKMFLENVGKR